MKLSKTPMATILMVLAFCPLFITSQAVFASESIGGDEMSFSRDDEQTRPYVLIALITAAALCGFAYHRIAKVKIFTRYAFRIVCADFSNCLTFLFVASDSC